MLKCCEVCGTEIVKEINRSRNSYMKKRYCSRACSAAKQSQKVNLPCERCKVPVLRSPSHLKQRVFCSVGCRSTLTEFTCEHCDVKFTSRPVWRSLEHIYCGTRCQGLARRKHRPQSQGRRSPEDLAWKVEVFRRQGRRCQMCPSTHRLVVHHIKGIAEFPHLRHDPDNGQVLCHDCHYYGVHNGAPNLIHGRYSKRQKRTPVPATPL